MQHFGRAAREFLVGRNVDEHPRDRVIFWGLFVVLFVVVIITDGHGARPWFALAAFLTSLTFVVVYARRPWRCTYAGRAVMLSMCVTALYTANAVAMLWWPWQDYAYPGWQDLTEFVYLCIAMAALYKLRALTRTTGPTA